ncbi:uncharacterized protein LOC128720041 [Anopheles nili]|uniref:uncharacterized protein LOC128720041 n=1 Tax=Anopheles nili TaxID=185578 RepID=UPI00237C4782|nr:uncharacterized protein LOC128720041 [Anopheles nili]
MVGRDQLKIERVIDRIVVVYFLVRKKKIEFTGMSRILTLVPFVLCLCRSGTPQDMHISEELVTCAPLDRSEMERVFAGAADDFFGKITVLFNVAPPKPVQTPRVFSERDPIYYYKIDYREQIRHYHNLYQMFHSQKEEYRNVVRFFLSASLHRVPYELEEYNFPEFYGSVKELAGEYNLTVYPNHLYANRTFALFGLREFQVYVIDRCSRVSYIIQPPWSLIQYAYVKAAVLSTFYDQPCGKCELENFLNSTLLEDEFHHQVVGSSNVSTESSTGSASQATKPYEDDSDETNAHDKEDEEEDEEAYGERVSSEEEESSKDDEDPFANLNVTGPDLELPLNIILPVMHVHVAPENDSEAASGYKLHQYIVLNSHQRETHADLSGSQQQEAELQELPLPPMQNSTVSIEPVSANSTSVEDKIRIQGTDWSAGELRLILNSSSVLYDPKEQRIFERLRRYNLSDQSQYDEVAEIAVSNRLEAWKRRRAPVKADLSRKNKRTQLKKHYARLIPWLNWTFGKTIPPGAPDAEMPQSRTNSSESIH